MRQLASVLRAEMWRRVEQMGLARLFLFVAVVTAIRLWIASALGLAPDEAYYWQWSNDLALSYMDHPPLIAWLIWLGTSIAGQTAFGVRLLTVLISAIAIGVAYQLGLAVGLTKTHASLTAALTSLLPAPAAGSIIATPDTPLGLCWLTALLALTSLAHSKSATAWYLLGIATGVGLLCKHSALLILIAVLFLAITTPRIRVDFRSVHPWLAATLALAFALPFIIADAKAGFGSISFQLSHLFGNLAPESSSSYPLLLLERLAGLIGGQIGLLTPLVAVWAIVSCVKLHRNQAHTVLVLGFLLPLVATGLSAITTHPEQNWAALGHPAAAILAMSAISKCYTENKPSKRKLLVWQAALISTSLAITVAIHIHTSLPFLPLPPARDPVSRLHGWNQLTALDETARQVDAVVCDTYGLAAETAWHLRTLSHSAQITSSDRPFPPPHGRWLLLWQLKDPTDKVNCEQIHSPRKHNLKRADGKSVRTISSALGHNCKGEGEDVNEL